MTLVSKLFPKVSLFSGLFQTDWQCFCKKGRFERHASLALLKQTDWTELIFAGGEGSSLSFCSHIFSLSHTFSLGSQRNEWTRRNYMFPRLLLTLNRSFKFCFILTRLSGKLARGIDDNRLFSKVRPHDDNERLTWNDLPLSNSIPGNRKAGRLLSRHIFGGTLCLLIQLSSFT